MNLYLEDLITPIHHLSRVRGMNKAATIPLTPSHGLQHSTFMGGKTSASVVAPDQITQALKRAIVTKVSALWLVASPTTSAESSVTGLGSPPGHLWTLNGEF